MAKYILTESLINKMECPTDKAKLDIYDLKTEGLVLTVYPSGKKTYFMRIRGLQGEVIRKKIADASAMSLIDARSSLMERLKKVAMGQSPLDTVTFLHSGVKTFSEFSLDYLAYVKAYKRSWKTDASNIANHLLPVFGYYRLTQITKSDVIHFLNQYRGSHKPSSTNRMLVLLRYMFNVAIELDIGVSKNPLKGIPKLEENNKIDRYLSVEESERLMRSLKLSGNKLLIYIIGLLLLTGARRGEVLNARWADFDINRRLWRIPISKSGKARYVPISDGALALLNQIPRSSGSVFLFASPLTGRPYHNIYESWNAARIRAGLTDVRIHDLRHSFASFLVNNGRSLYEVQTILGHADISTTQRYAHLAQSTLLDAANVASSSVRWASYLQVGEPGWAC